MIKQDVGINATSLTGDIVGARAALLFSVILLVAERYSLTSRCSRNVDADTLPRNCLSFQTNRHHARRTINWASSRKFVNNFSSVYWKRESTDLTLYKIYSSHNKFALKWVTSAIGHRRNEVFEDGILKPVADFWYNQRIYNGKVTHTDTQYFKAVWYTGKK